MVTNEAIRIDPEAEIEVRHTTDTEGNPLYVLVFFPGVRIGLTKEQVGKIVDETWPYRTFSLQPHSISVSPLHDYTFEEIVKQATDKGVCLHLLLDMLADYDTCGECGVNCCRPCFAIHQAYCSKSSV
jgi:hypothetical protein